jgi:hypothetical protein
VSCEERRRRFFDRFIYCLHGEGERSGDHEVKQQCSQRILFHARFGLVRDRWQNPGTKVYPQKESARGPEDPESENGDSAQEKTGGPTK